MKFAFISIVTIALSQFAAHAEESTGQLNATGQSQMTTPASDAKPSSVKFLLGLKSYNSSTRFAYLNDSASGPLRGQTYNGKQEIFSGFKMDSGWGAYIQMTQYRLEYNDRSLNKWSVSDPSLSLVHPDLYNDSGLKISGQARAYLPYTDRSKAKNIHQYAYYSTQIYDLGHGAEIANFLIPRWFAAGTYSAGDTKFYVEDRTVYTKKLNSWAKVGIGHWTQFEQHAATSPGFCMEIIPQFDYLINSKTTLGPRISFPVSAKNSVYDGPKNATTNEAKTELFFQTSL